MNKILTIIRHAKSDWTNECPDYDRTLNDRGRKDTRTIATALLADNFIVDQVFCSTAIRAKQTLQHLNTFLKISESKIQYSDALYLASLKQLISYCENLNNEINKVIIVGHNPGLTELCNYFTGDDLQNLPTCSVYCIHFPIEDWRAIGINLGRKGVFITPKILKQI